MPLPDFGINEDVSPNGVPTALTQNPDYYQALLQKINSPQYQAMQKEMQARSQEAIAQQQKGIQQNEDAVQDLEKQGPPVNWSPLTSLVNSWTGSKLESGVPGETAQSYQEKLLGLKNQLQGQRQGLTKEQIDSLKAQMDMFNPTKQLLPAMRLGQRQNMIGLAEDRQAAQAVKDMDNHPLIQASTKQLGQLQIDRHTIENSKIIPSQVLHEISNGIANALSGGRGVGLGMSEMQDLSTSKTAMAKLESYLTNNPHEAASPQVKKQIVDTLNRLEQAYGEYQSKLAQRLAQGRTYKNNPQAQEALRAAVGKYQVKMPQMKSSGSHPVDQMSDEEVIKAYNEKMGNK